MPQPFVPPRQLDRPLTEAEESVLRWILYLEDFPGADELRSQIPYVQAVWGRTTEIELAVAGGTRAPVRDGPLEGQALVVDDDENVTGWIAAWTKDGWLSSLMYSWVTDDMPIEYPRLENLRLWDPHHGLPSRHIARH